MFCPKCGKEVDATSIFCPHCGAKMKEETATAAVPETPKAADAPKPVQKDEFFEDVRPAQKAPSPAPRPVQTAQPAQPQQPAKNEGTNSLAVVGFILSFFFALAGLICSIIGLRQCKQYKDNNGRGLAIAGIVISSISLFLSFIVGIVYGAIIFEYIFNYSGLY